ncbi:hypothetical protein [Powai lake megavirus]|uniref:Uncharacterized protein n=1 Tax=Powai lake megavirus TaxID=1842663 RepID=A0A167RF26_9VIRU|nr:hypothetical protein QJ849_gp447 [Powai lake megavirus]ANB50609.1 hypothetical protein [Powai lake megavirus]
MQNNYYCDMFPAEIIFGSNNTHRSNSSLSDVLKYLVPEKNVSHPIKTDSSYISCLKDHLENQKETYPFSYKGYSFTIYKPYRFNWAAKIIIPDNHVDYNASDYSLEKIYTVHNGVCRVFNTFVIKTDGKYDYCLLRESYQDLDESCFIYRDFNFIKKEAMTLIDQMCQRQNLYLAGRRNTHQSQNSIPMYTFSNKSHLINDQLINQLMSQFDAGKVDFVVDFSESSVPQHQTRSEPQHQTRSVPQHQTRSVPQHQTRSVPVCQDKSQTNQYNIKKDNENYMDIFAKIIGTDSKNIHNDEAYYTDIYNKIMGSGEKNTEKNTTANYYMDLFSNIMNYNKSENKSDKQSQSQSKTIDQSTKYDPNELIDRVLNLMQPAIVKNTESNTNTNSTQVTKDGVEISDFDEMEGYDYIPSYNSSEFIEKMNQSESQPILSEESYCCDNHNSNKTVYSETISDHSEQDNSEHNTTSSDISGDSYSSNASDDDMPSLLSESDNDSIDKNEDAWKSTTWNEYINANVSVE